MLNAFLKIIFFILAGLIFGRLNKNKDEIQSFLNKYLYYLGLPAIIILKTSSMDLGFFNTCSAMINILPITAVSIAVFIFFKFKVLSANYARTLIITSVLGNTVYLGIPSSEAFFSQDAIAYAAMISAVHNLVIFTFSLMLVNLIADDSFSFYSFTKHTFKNPVLASSLTGIAVSFLNFKITGLTENILSEISKTVIPLSLITLGLSLYGKYSFKRFINPLLGISFIKLIALPFICFIFSYLCQENTVFYKVSLLQHAMPTAVMALIVSKELTLDEELVSKSIIFTTLLYFLLLPLYSFIFDILF
ncbi:MAG: hypothetical protein GX447_07615 [Elusimicrobia bacterium]|nr:hypothetical protein [Elusimicrobiota bacterium]